MGEFSHARSIVRVSEVPGPHLKLKGKDASSSLLRILDLNVQKWDIPHGQHTPLILPLTKLSKQTMSPFGSPEQQCRGTSGLCCCLYRATGMHITPLGRLPHMLSSGPHTVGTPMVCPVLGGMTLREASFSDIICIYRENYNSTWCFT